MTKYAAKGTQLKIGDGGVGAGTKASRSMGTSNQTLMVGWNTAGTVGNSKTVEVVENGNNTPLSVVVSTSSVLINVETDGSGNSVSTVNDVIAKLYADEVFAANWFANDGAGDGTGLVDTDFASAALTGGAAGAEVFTLIPSASDIQGPGLTAESIDVTTHDTAGDYREIIPTFLSGGEVTFNLMWDPANSVHEGLFTDYEAKTLRNFQEIFPDGTDWAFSAYVTQIAPSAPIGEALTLAVTLSVTGAVDRTP